MWFQFIVTNVGLGDVYMLMLSEKENRDGRKESWRLGAKPFV